MNYFEKLAKRSRDAHTLLCVGLDPEFSRHEPDKVASYNRAIIDATAEFAACYKPNIAFYEQWGIPGLRALEETISSIPAGIPVIGDVKRGDIGSTAAAYARAMFDSWGFDAITLNGYLGRDSIEPFLAYEDKGFYLLCRTSNPGAADLQYLDIEGGNKLYEQVALTVTQWSTRIGLVVGATAPAELRRIRELVPNASLLIPGVGAQGGKPAEVIAAAGSAPGSLVVSASRSIYYASEGHDLFEAAATAARTLRDELNAAAPPVGTRG